VDLASLIVDVFQTIAMPNEVKLSFDIKTLPKIRVDPTFTRRALTNLINNAIQAMPDGGQLEISAYQEKSKIYITINDTGVGIPEEVQSKLFTPMFTTKAKGQGLGLAVVKRLVEAQGGTISFVSTIGKGTKFTIKLPLPIG
jgi:signal transduction histidine kinase